MNLYEHTIIARQDVSPTQIKQIQEKYSKIVEKFDGNIVKLENWGLMNLSYLIKKNILELHIAHNEGNYFCSDEELKAINENNQVALTYCNFDGADNEEFNPNGAIKNIAGVFNKNKNVLGMMPHPERMIDKYLSGKDGSIFFENLLKINN